MSSDNDGIPIWLVCFYSIYKRIPDVPTHTWGTVAVTAVVFCYHILPRIAWIRRYNILCGVWDPTLQSGVSTGVFQVCVSYVAAHCTVSFLHLQSTPILATSGGCIRMLCFLVRTPVTPPRPIRSYPSHLLMDPHGESGGVFPSSIAIGGGCPFIYHLSLGDANDYRSEHHYSSGAKNPPYGE
jgi:hypothetical protein